MTLTAIIQKFQRRSALFFKRRPASFPYISGDSFRSLSTKVLDEYNGFKPAEVRPYELVFVSGPFLDTFFSSYAPAITEPYILISHNGDQNITKEYLKHLNENIVIWFAQNCLVTHEKIRPIPIGLENLRFYLHGIPRNFEQLQHETKPKKYRILYKFNEKTNPLVRGHARKVLESHPLATTYNDWRTSLTYLRTLQDYAFVASPVGNGEDCIRTWESMYLRTIPIVTRSVLTGTYERIGLPILLIDNWDDVTKLDEVALQEAYARITPRFDSPALWMDYWQNEISNCVHDHQSKGIRVY